MSRLPNLDVLRFFSASIVMLFHIPQLSKNQSLPFYDGLPVFHRGSEAVFMFFTLSGFLIIRLIYQEKERKSFSIKKFYIRRVLRIFPLYYLIVFFGLVFYNVLLPIFNIPFEIRYDIYDTVLLFLFSPNIFSKLYEPGGILEILWSIGIEEQFYLFIAPLLYFIRVKYLFKSILILLVLYFIAFHFSELYWLKKYQFYYYFLFAGGLISILEIKNKLNFLKKTKWISFIIVFFTVLFFFTDIFITRFYWLNSLIMMILFALFINTISHNNYDLKIKNRFLNYFGKISYGIYMFHAIVMNIVVFAFMKIKLLQDLPESLIIFLIYSLIFVLTIIISHISYKYFESYFLNLKRNYKV